MNRSISETLVTQAPDDAGRREIGGRPIARAVQRRLPLLLTTLGAVMTEIADEQLKETDLTGREYAILAILVDDGPDSQLELAQMLGKAPALIVASIDRLEEAGLVERTRDPHDRRRSRVKVTRKGLAALHRGDATADRVVANMLDGLDQGELGELAQLLGKGVGATAKGSPPGE